MMREKRVQTITHDVQQKLSNFHGILDIALYHSASQFYHLCFFPKFYSSSPQWQNCTYEYRKIRLFENHTKNVWVLFKKPKLVAIAAKQKKIGRN
jgi:hypothetical protein